MADHTLADGSQEITSGSKTRKGGYTPGILYECQNKGLTKLAIRKLLILKDAVCLLKRAKIPPEKAKAAAGLPHSKVLPVD